MEQESQTIDSLYDFLYIDRERASSLTTQLYGPGVVTTVKQTATDSDKSSKGAGVSLKVLKGNASVEEAISRTQERHFDATWSLPINLLDKLSEAKLINRGLNGERLGNTVLTKGRMRIFDISMLQNAIPFISKLFLNERNNNQQKSQKKIKPEDIPIAPGVTIGMVSEFLSIVPNTLQVDFLDDQGNTIWMTINRDFLTINPDDMVLKYGGSIPGEWYVLGLIDALPDSEIGQDDLMPETFFPDNLMKNGLTQMLDGIKEIAGRSNDSYGMTPLLIFRTVS